MMDERASFSQEMILRALMNRVNENTDLLNLLLQSAEFTEEGIGKISGSVDTIKSNTEQINDKLDAMIEKINSLERAFLDLKDETREVDQKIILMSGKLDRIEKSIDEEELEDYYVLCQSLYSNWDSLEALTRRLIPVAEYLFSSLQRYNKPDYSPVILELCRALENEFLLKIFTKYSMDVIRRKGSRLDSFLAADKASAFLQNKTGMFVKALTKSARTRKPEYTLGQMNTIMSLANDTSVVSASPLLQDFREYLEQETVISDLLNVQYIRKINDLVEKYRNPAAHPGFMTLDKAKKCKEIMPERLDYLMDCLS
jgi:hypothetical protein